MLNANGVKTITRSGTTFTVTRNDNTSFTFDQQDNNTWTANSASAAGYVAKGVANKVWKCDANGSPAWRDDANTWTANSSSAAGYVASGSGHANKVWKTDGNGNPAWRDDANTTYGLASTSANGLLRQLNGNTSYYMRGDGTWQIPPNTNTWRGIQNNLTSTSTTDSLSANMGKTLWDRLNTVAYVLVQGGGAKTVSNAWVNLVSVTVTKGTWIIFGNARTAGSQSGKTFTLRFSFGSFRQTCYVPTADNATVSLCDTYYFENTTTIYVQAWSGSISLESSGITALRIRDF